MAIFGDPKIRKFPPESHLPPHFLPGSPSGASSEVVHRTFYDAAGLVYMNQGFNFSL